MNRLKVEEQNRLEEQAPRTWQRMLSGRRLNLINPSAVDIEIHDIALGLSRNTRWNGQTTGDHGWSVAQHSLLVVDILQQQNPGSPSWVLLAALLHDAAEYVTHDLITPLKAAVGDVFKVIEDRLQAAVHTRYSLPVILPEDVKANIKRADLIAAATEAVHLAGFTSQEVKSILKISETPYKTKSLDPLPSNSARDAYLKLFDKLDNAHRHSLNNSNFV